MFLNSYSDEDKYIFISYSHNDKDAVLPIIQKLSAEGYRLWYDSGIHPGTEWAKVIAKQIKNCYYFLAFMSDHYLNSDNCVEELDYARRQEKNRLVVYLEEVVLPDELDMRLGHIQSIYKYNYKTESPFYKQLFSSENLDFCKVSKDDDAKSEKNEESDPPNKTEKSEKGKPIFKKAPLFILLLSTVLLIIACPLRAGAIPLSLLLIVMALNIWEKTRFSTLAFCIWSQACFWLASILAARTLFESIIGFAGSAIPIWSYDAIFILVFALLYYRPKWMTGAKSKAKKDTVLAVISIVLALGTGVVGALVAQYNRSGYDLGNFRMLPTRYENEHLGIGFYVPDGWDTYDSISSLGHKTEYMHKLIDIASFAYEDNDDAAQRVETVSPSLEMIATSKNEEGRVSMINLRFSEDSGSINYTLRHNSIALSDFIDWSYDEGITTEFSMQIGSKSFSGDLYETEDFCAYVFYVVEDKIATVFIVEAPDGEATEALIERFYPLPFLRTIEMLWQTPPTGTES